MSTKSSTASESILNTQAEAIDTNDGVDYRDREILAKHLSNVLADTCLLNLKTQAFHWNVVGPLFYSLHKLTEAQYDDMTKAIDVIAERIRAIGYVAPGSFKQFVELSTIKEEADTPTAEEMIKQLIDDNESCSRRLRTTAVEADKARDVKTADLLTERIGRHEENVWMLRAILAS